MLAEYVLTLTNLSYLKINSHTFNYKIIGNDGLLIKCTISTDGPKVLFEFFSESEL